MLLYNALTSIEMTNTILQGTDFVFDIQLSFLGGVLDIVGNFLKKRLYILSTYSDIFETFYARYYWSRWSLNIMFYGSVNDSFI